MEKMEIVRMDHFGRGIGYKDQTIVFVDNALPKEIVEVEIDETHKTFYHAVVKNYIKSSPQRIKPSCPYYQKCGGCQLQHINYEDTLKFKKAKIENIFAKEKIVLPPVNIIKNDQPYYYRNKISLQIKDGQIGFYQEKTHHLVAIEKCILAKESINTFLKHYEKLQIKNGLITIRSNSNDELLIIITTQDEVKFEVSDFKDCKIVGVIVNKKTIYGTNYFLERINSRLFKVSYDAFFQVNLAITSKLFTLLENHIQDAGNVLDLYAGVGSLGIVASQHAQSVYSVEVVYNAVLDNLENKKLNHCDNILVFLGKTEKVIDHLKMDLNTLIVDPPRKGLDKETLAYLIASQAKQIIYISCDPMTLVRDIKKLASNYELKEYYLLDMFSYTYHVESFCVLKLR